MSAGVSEAFSANRIAALSQVWHRPRKTLKFSVRGKRRGKRRGFLGLGFVSSLASPLRKKPLDQEKAARSQTKSTKLINFSALWGHVESVKTLASKFQCTSAGQRVAHAD